jgi:hypothetical protein
MNFSHGIVASAVLVLIACGGGGSPDAAERPPVVALGSEPTAASGTELRCEPSPRMPVEGRASPYDSTVVQLGDAQAKVCYGRPSARGRTMLGGEHVPHGQLWRTGANEPTIIHLPVAVEIAGIPVEPGSYSLYTVPGETEWEVIVNRSTEQWGHESAYTDEIRAQEVGRARVPAQRTAEHIETFTIRSEPAADRAAQLVLEWEHTRVAIPIRAR